MDITWNKGFWSELFLDNSVGQRSKLEKTNAIIYDGETMLTAQVCWQKDGFTF